MEDVKKAVERAEYFTVQLFRGVGKFDRGACDSLASAREMGAEMEKAANNGKRALIYAVCGERGVLVPRDFVL